MHPVPILPVLARHPWAAAVGAAGLLLLAALAAWAVLRDRDTPEQRAAQRETLRRDRLAASGRVTDGSLLDALPSLSQPETVRYRYRIAGVTYECIQHISPVVTSLHRSSPGCPLDPSHTHAPLPDLPIQVRYDRANPGDSIVLSATWNGLWSLTSNRSDDPPAR